MCAQSTYSHTVIVQKTVHRHLLAFQAIRGQVTRATELIISLFYLPVFHPWSGNHNPTAPLINPLNYQDNN